MKILVFGDSHSSFFGITHEMSSINENYKGIECIVTKIPGATIGGFRKNSSILNTREMFKNEMNKAGNIDYVVLCMGQVDIELGLYYRRLIKNEDVSIAVFVNGLIEKYSETINWIKHNFNLLDSQIIVKGVNLSVLINDRAKAVNYTKRIVTEDIKTKEDMDRYKQKLWEIFPCNTERKINHLLFNKKINEMCGNLNISYFDINNEISDEKGNVSAMFIPTLNDHHLCDSLHTRMLHIDKLLYTIEMNSF